MILDALLQLSNSQAVTSSAVATNVIDLGADRAIGVGEPMGIVFTVEVAADQTSSDEDYQFDIEGASDAGQTTAVKLLGRIAFESGTPTAPALDADLLVVGFQFCIPLIVANLSVSERYLGVRYVTAGTSPTITVSAHLQPLSMVQNDIVHAQSIVIS